MNSLEDKEQLLAPLLDLLSEQGMDIELEFEDMEIEGGGIKAELNGKALLAVRNEEKKEE